MVLDYLFGSKERKARALVARVNAREEEMRALTDTGLFEASRALRDRVRGGAPLDEILPEAFALVREAARRTLGQRHFDVQLMGGVYLHAGAIVEMLTGEGKTLAATAPAYLNALSGEGVHIITVNDYLAKRDAVQMGQIYHALGLSVACLVHEGAYRYDPEFTTSEEEKKTDEERDTAGAYLVKQQYLKPISRRDAYNSDIVYGTNHEFGFDYLRDNLAYAAAERVQTGRGRVYAIIDEADSILIDEARTPLIIAAPDSAAADAYKVFARVVEKLIPEEEYLIDEKMRSVEITEAGINRVEAATGIKNLYSPESLRLVHYLEASLKAKALYLRDRDYVVRDGEVVIVDPFTGRLMFGRRYAGGLHLAIEAKEGVAVRNESKTYAQITIQNYFRLYKKIAGMTGTAQTSAEEFHKVYGVETVSVPPNRTLIRKDLQDLVYKTTKAKYEAIVEEVRRRRELGQPMLIGTVSIEKNEELSAMLSRAGIEHEILNAKNHEREGAIIAQAGRFGAVTLATNMAGRGVDIILGGNPSTSEEAAKVRELGGLHVIGTERHESRRIDNQLRGRSGRQGDPGSTQFFLSLDDDLMRIFGGERIKGLMESLKVPEDMPIESGIVSGAISEAQKKVEGMNFDARKSLLEYDDVLNKQRLVVYRRREEILSGEFEVFRGKLREALEGYAARVAPEDSELAGLREKIERVAPEHNLRATALSILDTLWLNHLEDIESLTESVRIRAYGQHDPLVEYRRESHLLYHNLLARFDEWVVNALRALDLEKKPVPEEPAEERPQGVLPAEVMAKAGRNDPCPCGATKPDGTPKKFKHCHGR